MSQIIKLDNTLINQISAGEVVERPFSVVKELVENSIDAKSTHIIISIENGGKTYISISDNGQGIDKNNLEISIDKYTTSKLKNLDDLYNIMTFGFRGEALASISSVSNFSITSKPENQELAYKLEFNSIDGKSISSVSGNNGTNIIVKNLFFNTPARLNYLKNDRTEYSKILDYLHSISLSHPEIGFEFINDNRQIFKFSSNEDLKTRIFSIYGNDFYENLVDINIDINGIKISGYITNPRINFLNKNRQNIFINTRPIFSPIIYKAISNAYNRFIPHNTFPGYVLNIQIDPTAIDVNVHPRKQEIRFENEQLIFKTVFNGILDRLKSVTLIDNGINEVNENLGEENRNISTNNPNNEANNFSNNNEKYYTGNGTKFYDYSPYKNVNSNPSQVSIKDSINFTKNILNTSNITNNTENKNTDITETKLGKIVGQIFNSYIIVENEKSLLIFDQHALAERIIYEKLIKNQKNNNSQKLLIQENIKLTSKEINLLEENLETFKNIGFEIEFLSNNIISILGIPDFIKEENIGNIILGILGDIENGNKDKLLQFEEIKNKIYAYTACRSAIKFGNKLSLFEINKLLNDTNYSYSMTCPHGRPVIFELGLEELMKKFKR